jgi:hypothetical protein
MGKVKVDLSLVDLAALLLSLFSTTHFTVTSISSVVSHFLQKIQQCINNRHEQYKVHQTIAPDHCSIVRMVVTMDIEAGSCFLCGCFTNLVYVCITPLILQPRVPIVLKMQEQYDASL